MEKEMIETFGILYRSFVNYTNEYLKETDITFAQSVILANIGNNEDISQEEIAVKHLIDRAAIARNVKELEQKGYVKTLRSGQDKRRKILMLTEKGNAVFELISRNNKQRLAVLFQDISDKEKQSFMKTLAKLCENTISDIQ